MQPENLPESIVPIISHILKGYLIGSNLPGRNLPIFEKGGKFLPGNLKDGQVLKWTQIRKILKIEFQLYMFLPSMKQGTEIL